MKRVGFGILPMIAVDGKGPKPSYRQIYDAYRMAIVEGSLRPGQWIPSTRVLAAELGVSRFPVLKAYDQLLADGYCESRVGAGTVVSSSLPDLFASSASASAARLLAARSVPRPGPRP
ncbi:MAG TPA: winged helix-turn-helix domain-containing protein, partial [Terriglobales bacterium]